jgi:hypothetical protein
MDTDELTRIFTQLGAPDPEGWAASEITEGINQLGRFLFLKGAWSHVVADDDTTWMDRSIEGTPVGRDRPFDGVAHALRRLIDAGADRNDLNQLVRGMQVELLSGVCSLLDDAAAVEGNQYQHWVLVGVDSAGGPGRPILGLHESVLETDPTGREMRPRPIADP